MYVDFQYQFSMSTLSGLSCDEEEVKHEHHNYSLRNSMLKGNIVDLVDHSTR